jgi:hypothetical protein
MTGQADGDLPLHDEAKARSKWRGGETLLDESETGGSGPASEVDDAAQGGGHSPREDLAQRPPD